MENPLFKRLLRTINAYTDGSKTETLNGYAATKLNPRDFDIHYFSSDSTLILGSRLGATEATWEIDLKKKDVSAIESGFLAIGCVRIHGGLHSRKRSTSARIYLNDHPRDQITLKAGAEGHTDYFHRPLLPEFPLLWPISACSTLYAWAVDTRHLREASSQIVRLELDRHVTWDIDHLALVLFSSKRELRDGVKEILLLIAGAFLGAIAALLLGA